MKGTILFTYSIDHVSNNDYTGPVKSSEFKRWLAEQGATFTSGRGSYLHVELNGKFSVMPMHKSKEIGTGLVAKIKKDLGIK